MSNAGNKAAFIPMLGNEWHARINEGLEPVLACLKNIDAAECLQWIRDGKRTKDIAPWDKDLRIQILIPPKSLAEFNHLSAESKRTLNALQNEFDQTSGFAELRKSLESNGLHIHDWNTKPIKSQVSGPFIRIVVDLRPKHNHG